MLSKLYGVIAILSVSLLLAASGFMGYLYYAGRITPARLEKIAATLRGELDDPPTTEMPAPAPPEGGEATADGRAQSADAIRTARQREQLRRALGERAAADLSARQALLDQTLAHLVKLQEQFKSEQDAWVKRREVLASEARDRGFKKELEYVSNLPPKQAKEHILRTWAKQKADVVRLFMAMPPRTGQRIMEELKTPADLEVLHELLEQLRLQDVESLATESRKKPGAGVP